MNKQKINKRPVSPMILKRQEQLRKIADSYLMKLIEEYIAFKNSHIIGEKNGIISFDPEVNVFGLKLVEKWINYCGTQNAVRNRVLNYNYAALPEAIDNHMKSHIKLAWFNECLVLLSKKGIDDPNMDVLSKLWDGKLTCRQGVNRYMKASA